MTVLVPPKENVKDSLLALHLEMLTVKWMDLEKATQMAMSLVNM